MKNKRLVISIIAGLLALAMLVGLIAAVIPRNVSAATSGELKEQLDALISQQGQISDKIAALEDQQSANMSDMESIIAQKDLIDQQIALMYEEIDNINAQIASYNLLIADKQEELDEAEARLAELNDKNKERIRAMEEEGELSYWSVLFKANSFSDLLDRLNMMAEIAAADQRRLEEMAQVAQEIAAAQEILTAEKAELETTKAELEAKQLILDAKNEEADKLLADLVVIAEDLEAMHNQFEAEEEDFLDQIAMKEQEYNDQLAYEEEQSRQASIQASIEASKQESIAASRQESIEESIAESIRKEEEASREAEANRATEPPEENVGGSYGDSDNPSGTVWLVPCDYSRVSSPFGYRWHPVTGEWSMHKGVDLTAPRGTPIYASRSGYVTIAGWGSTAGNYVTINHQDGYSSVYMHMTRYVVSEGDYVGAGELIGYVGSTGRSTGYHLHFGISYYGEYVNPMDYIG